MCRSEICGAICAMHVREHMPVRVQADAFVSYWHCMHGTACMHMPIYGNLGFMQTPPQRQAHAMKPGQVCQLPSQGATTRLHGGRLALCTYTLHIATASSRQLCSQARSHQWRTRMHPPSPTGHAWCGPMLTAARLVRARMRRGASFCMGPLAGSCTTVHRPSDGCWSGAARAGGCAPTTAGATGHACWGGVYIACSGVGMQCGLCCGAGWVRAASAGGAVLSYVCHRMLAV